MAHVICTVDVVLMTLREGVLKVLTVKREKDPFSGAWSLPGGYVHAQEDQSTQDAARRVLLDKAGLRSLYLEQLQTVSGPARDPRGWSLSVVYYALVSFHKIPPSLIGEHHWIDVNAVPRLAFDHNLIIETALQRIRSKSQYSSLPVYLCEETFTLPQLQTVYEVVLGERINKVSFRRKMEAMGMLEAVPGAQTVGDAHRPAQLYRLKKEFHKSLSLTDRGLNT